MADFNKQDTLETIVNIGKHIKYVQQNMQLIIDKLTKRAIEHDESKYFPDEVEDHFFSPSRPTGAAYDSDEYREWQETMKNYPGTVLHKTRNDHHPEHYADINDMPLIALIEMVCDWKAAHQIQNSEGDWKDSIEINDETYKFNCHQLWVIRQVAQLLDDVR